MGPLVPSDGPLWTDNRTAGSEIKRAASEKRIVVWDINPVFAEGLALVLKSDPFLSKFNIISGAFDNLDTILALGPEVLIVDPCRIGVAREIELAAFYPICSRTSVICYAADLSPSQVRQLISLGFRGIVSTTTQSEDLVRIVSSIAYGGTFISDVFNTPPQRGGVSVGDAAIIDILTEREADVLHRVAMGNSLKEIAAALQLSAKTVDTYKSRASRKLDLRTRAAIVRFAIDSGWLN